MRYRAFLLISALALLTGLRSLACGPYYYEPEYYFMYRVSDHYLPVFFWQNQPFDYNFESEDNCRLWQKQTTPSASLDDIYQVVYKYSIEDLTKTPSGKRNSFTKWLKTDKEAREFLVLAKECEKARAEMVSPWYYPSKKDPQKATLDQIAARAMSYRGRRLAGRYALQAVRALHSLRRYDDCINYWNKTVQGLPDDVITRMAAGYVGGAYANIGDTDKAAELFAFAGDVESFRLCLKKDSLSFKKRTKEIYPDSQDMRRIIAREITLMQPWDKYTDAPKWSKSEVEKREDFKYCIEVGKNPRYGHKDFWYYSAAFIMHVLGQDQEASRLLSIAEKHCGEDELLAESIRVFRIYLDAVLTPYSPSYASQMVRELAWLDGKIVEHYPEVRKEAVNFGIYYMRTNISFFYWNDMMRKIVLGAICPKLVENGQGATAIAFANMADNRLLNLVGEVEDGYYDKDGYYRTFTYSIDKYRANERHNVYDYSNELFLLLDSIPCDDIIRFVNSMGHPQGEVDAFLQKRGNTDKNFFREVLGTMLLRDMRYAEAEQYLRLIPASYQSRLNTYKEGYLRFDPFSVVRRSLDDKTDYKLTFARTMADLEGEIRTQKDPNRKALALFKYATGMQNSVSTCWALTFYGKNWGCDDPAYGPTPMLDAQKRLFTRAEKLYAQALATATDREIIAGMHLRLKNLRTVMEKYDGTVAHMEADIYGCDVYYDYHLEDKEQFKNNIWIEF